MTTWILVAQRSGARIFEHEAPGAGLQLVNTILHEEGRLRDREINADRPGSSMDHNTGAQHGMSSEESPHERVVADFVRSLAKTLESARVEHRYSKLVLVAEPRMLGLLREALDAPTTALVIGSLDKDYYPRDQDHLLKALGEFISV
jgi:protein required for attachment to host cells